MPEVITTTSPRPSSWRGESRICPTPHRAAWGVSHGRSERPKGARAGGKRGGEVRTRRGSGERPQPHGSSRSHAHHRTVRRSRELSRGGVGGQRSKLVRRGKPVWCAVIHGSVFTAALPRHGLSSTDKGLDSDFKTLQALKWRTYTSWLEKIPLRKTKGPHLLRGCAI